MSLSARSSRLAAALGLGAVLLGGAGCPAVYPEIATKTSKAMPGQTFDPGPPDDLKWVRFVGARVPPKTRDGRAWDEVLGSLPDPYARLLVNGKELLRTPIQTDTLTPTWPDGPRGNFLFQPGDKLRVELWDSNPLYDEPIGVRDLVRPAPGDGPLRIDLEGGAEVSLALEPAHALVGLGLWFELRSQSVYITRLFVESPAARAGIERGDRVLTIGGRDVKDMSAAEVRSAFNAVPSGGLALSLKHADGAVTEVVLQVGPIYPTHAEYGELP
jgi:hypothetical protein